MSELKPCPFCGGEPDTVSGDYHGERKFVRVYCKQCQCRTWCEPTKSAAVRVWNTRHSVPSGWISVDGECKGCRFEKHNRHEDECIGCRRGYVDHYTPATCHKCGHPVHADVCVNVAPAPKEGE